MAKFELTEEQKRAVTTRESSVLVSAAAGSGKTRVLTERLARYVTDPEDPHDVGEFLVITYTRAAAAELRGRILAELQTRAAAEPENKCLRRQVTLCCRAPIGTIHSFCTTALREFGHRIGLTPDFRVADEDKCAELREKALEKTFDAAYENIEADSAFASLVDSVGAGRDDRRLAQAVLDLHAKMQSHPYPEKWAAETKCGLDVSAVADAGGTVWGEELLTRAKQTVRYWHDRFERVWQALGADDQVAAAYGGSVEETLFAMREFLRAADLGWDAACVRLPIPFSRLKPLKEHEEEKAAFQTERDACKKAMQSVNAMFDAPSAALLKELSVTAPAMGALIDLTLRFDAAYAAEKKRLNLLDFSDLEHRAVQLLWDEEGNEQTETAKTLSQRYTEIMVDEYQDVSGVQDLLFRAVSRDEKNIFMVGDVKQSIYRFRLADPSIFLRKYKDYKPADDASGDEPRKILLQRNFRSDSVILDACNHVFENTMSEKLGDVRYDDGARLVAPEGAEKRGRAVLTVLDVPDDGGAGRADKTYLEGRMVARQIRTLVDRGETILDGGGERPMRWGDFAVLMRSPGTAGPAFRRALAEEHIPLVSEQGGGFFASPEVQIVRSLLSVIDNPHRDVPLTAVLLSPVFGFSADALAAIRARAPEGGLYTALARAAKDCGELEKKPEPVRKERTEWATDEGVVSCPAEPEICEEDGAENEGARFTPEQSERCAAFLKNLNELRWLSADIGVYELLCLLYDRFGLPEKCAALSGEARNLSLLLDCAAEFEENGYRGIYAFIKQLSRMEARGDEPSAPSGESENAVTIMSIHKSKGLEFPVVFLVNTARQFNKMDQRAPVLVHPVLGLGCKVTESARGIEYPTLARRAIASRLTDELLSEEMRVLYVAMTRARERLYISCAAGAADAYIGGFQSVLASPLEPEVLRGAHCMADWLVPAALLPDSPLEIKTETAKPDGEAAPKTDSGPEKAPETADPALVEVLRENLSFCYGHREAEPLPAKLTATSLPEYDPDGEPVTRRRYHSFRTPVLTEQTRKLTGAERGTATHIVMQFIDFAHVSAPAEIEKEIARIEALGQLDAAQAKAVDREAVWRFFESKTGQRLLNADHIWRELKFSVLCPAEKFYPNVQGEELLLQGVMDCVIEENGRLTVVDYKTDYVTDETLPEVTEHYRPQVRAYLYAAEKMFEKPAAGGLLFFLRGGQTAEIVP